MPPESMYEVPGVRLRELSESLAAIDTALAALATDDDDYGRRVYLAYLIAVEGRANQPNESRRETIAGLCGRFDIGNPFPTKPSGQ